MWVAKFAFLLTLMLWVGPAAAATVAILQPLGSTEQLREAAFRIQGELVAVGLAVALVERPPGPDTHSEEARAWFEHSAEAQGLDAFIDVVGEDALLAVDVWLWERSTRRLTVSRVSLDPRARNAAATAAIRAIEVLRSSFLVFDSSAPPPRREARVTASPDHTPPPARAARRIGLSAGAAALTSVDGVGPAVLPLLRFEWLFGAGVALQATAAGFGTHPEVGSDAGGAEVAQQLALLGLCACSADSGLRPTLALAGGVLRTALEGSATEPNLAHRVEQWSSLFEASAGARLNWSERYQLTLAAHAQLAMPYVRVRIVDSVVATSGRPNLLLSVALGGWL